MQRPTNLSLLAVSAISLPQCADLLAFGLMYLGDYSTIGPGYYMSIAHWLNC